MRQMKDRMKKALLNHMKNYSLKCAEENTLNAIKDHDKSKAYLYYNLAKIKGLQLDYEEAEKYFKKAIECDPDNKEYKEEYAKMLKEKAF